jgi:uncharacterized repeat protein (TIGR03843 family)
VDGDATAARLLAAPLEVVGRFHDASNATLLVRLTDRDPRPLAAIAEDLGRDPGLDDLDADDLAVHKPRDGERPLWDFPEGTLHRREVAAHALDVALGAGLVPTTVLRDDGPYGPGSLQAFVPHDPERHWFTLRPLLADDATLRERVAMLAAFDVVADNADRKGGHVLVGDGDGPVAQRLRAVDHGVTFNVEPKLRTVVWDLADAPLPDAVHDAVAGVVAALDGRAAPPRAADLAATLAGLLDPDEVAVTRERAAALLAAGRLPLPVGPNPLPWPLL